MGNGTSSRRRYDEMKRRVREEASSSPTRLVGAAAVYRTAATPEGAGLRGRPPLRDRGCPGPAGAANRPRRRRKGGARGGWPAPPRAPSRCSQAPTAVVATQAVRRRGLHADPQHLAPLDSFDGFAHGRHQGQQMLHPIAPSTNHHHAETQPAQVLLELDALIGSEEHGESGFRRSPKQRAVLEPAPTLLLYGPAVVATSSRASWRGRDSSRRTRTPLPGPWRPLRGRQPPARA